MKKALAVIAVLGCFLGLAAQGSLDSGLLRYYPFNASLLDSLGSDTATMESDTAYTKGKHGMALQLNGRLANTAGSKYADIKPVAFDTLKEFSISMWVRPVSIGADGEGFFFAGNHHAGWVGVAVFWNNLRFSVGSRLNTSDAPLAFPFQSSSLRQWNLYTLCYARDTLYAYVNDSLLGKKYQKVRLGSPEAMLGTHQFGLPVSSQKRSHRFSGGIDELRIYKRRLSHEEIRRLYKPVYTNIPRQGKDAALFSVYPNPAKGQLRIAYNAEEAPIRLQFYSPAGQLLKQSTSGGGAEDWSIGSLSPGIYILRGFQGKKAHQQRVVIR